MSQSSSPAAPSEAIDTAIIGGGQSGLAVSWHLSRQGRAHVILERARLAERWRSERWDSLMFQFPNHLLQLPGLGYSGPDPEGFATRDEVVAFLETYAQTIQAPVRCGISVEQLSQGPDGTFRLETSQGPMSATNVVIATGPYQHPVIPSVASAVGAVHQLHASAYRNPATLPPGAVLVVGAGASGAQIAEDILRGGRQVYLAVGSHRGAPRRYRGKDFSFWEFATGAFDQRVEDRAPGTVPPLLTGVGGGRDMDLRQLGQQGVMLLGRLSGGTEGRLTFADDLPQSLARAKAQYDAFIAAADAHALAAGLDLPKEIPPAAAGDLPPAVLALDPAEARVSAVIWATGYRQDFRWIDLPIFADPLTRTQPRHQRGVTEVPGLYLIGLPWLSKRKSSLMAGMGEDAAYVAQHLTQRGRSVPPRP